MRLSLGWRGLFLLWLGVLIPLVPGVASSELLVAVVYLAAVFLLIAVDFKRIGRSVPLGIIRDADESFTLATEATVHLRISNGSPRSVRLNLRDTPSNRLTDPVNAVINNIEIPGKKKTVAEYLVTPTVRGDAEFGDIFVRIAGPMGLANRDFTIPHRRRVRVLPDQREAAKFTLLANRNRLHQSGIRSARVQGVGREFESLRDYLPDDEMRRVDWKATARKGHLVSRQFETERSQTLILMVDVGRTMRTVIGSMSKLDYAITAVLLLARVAAQSDDRVGLIVFSNVVHAYVPPGRGNVHLHNLLMTLYNLQAGTEESDYRSVISYLDVRWRKRALVVCFTDLWDPDSARETINEIAQLRVRHLPIVVTLEDTNLEEAAAAPALTRDEMFDRATALQMRSDRQKAISALKARRVAVLDAPADQLSIALVNQYLQIKQQMQI